VAKKGWWVAGFTSKELCGDETGSERLVFLMEITDIMPIHKYFNCEKFQRKIPNLKTQDHMDHVGDNIYKPKVEYPCNEKEYYQIENPSHGIDSKKDDLSGKYVLISDNFHYFGRNPIEIDIPIRPKVPKSQAGSGWREDNIPKAKRFIRFIEDNYQKGMIANPTRWKCNCFTEEIQNDIMSAEMDIGSSDPKRDTDKMQDANDLFSRKINANKSCR